MSAVIKSCKLIKESGSIIEIERVDSPFAERYFNDTENIEKLNSFCKEYYEKDIKVAIKAPPKATANKGEEPNMIERQEIPDSVKEVLSVFKGELKKDPAA